MRPLGKAQIFRDLRPEAPGPFRRCQEVHIGIDENGVEAAAFTEILWAGAALPQGRAEMILNRPFLYAVKNKGQILFVGICQDPVP